MKYEIVSERRIRKPVKAASSEALYNLVKRYAAARQEHFIVITLNGANEVISLTIASIGIVNRTVIHPREVFCRAIKDMAVSVILCHNHPSGQTRPSSEDMEITHRLVEAGKLLGIPVIDHLIISKSGYYSMQKEGCFLKLHEKAANTFSLKEVS